MTGMLLSRTNYRLHREAGPNMYFSYTSNTMHLSDGKLFHGTHRTIYYLQSKLMLITLQTIRNAYITDSKHHILMDFYIKMDHCTYLFVLVFKYFFH